MNPGFASNIFKSIRQEAGRNALKLARSLEKSTYKLEAHHRHLNFTHCALENRWFPKSLRFKAPGNQQIFKRIMERTSITACEQGLAFATKRSDQPTASLPRIVINYNCVFLATPTPGSSSS